MRLPSRTELSIEQEKVYTDAPLSGTVFITGPPGTGKTVLAVYRAMLLKKQKVSFKLVMYNKVLNMFTNKVMLTEELGDNVSTWHSWVYKWWQEANRGSKNWKIPEISKFQPDFGQALILMLTNKVVSPGKLGWGHLIIDEGQDFPAQFYQLARVIIEDKRFQGEGHPSITVLADENQRLNENQNSTIPEIAKALGVKNTWALTENFRNTLEIAKFSSSFYVGNPSALPRLPESRRGPKPVLQSFPTVNDEALNVMKYIKNYDDQDVAIFLPSVKMINVFYQLVEAECLKSKIKLQAYASSGRFHDDKSLKFGGGGSITILTDKSCKGLEFDAVFIPQLNLYDAQGADESFSKMKFYVMSSRARKSLFLSYSDCLTPPDIIKIFPLEKSGLLEWRI
jgi:superfamily I DNA/RNA helicase